MAEPDLAERLIVVAFGGGLDSTVALVEMRERDIVPDATLFADTGGEKPETYAHVGRMNTWCIRNGFPEIVTVKKRGKHGTLENDCLNNKMLPSIAYGRNKSCSIKWKHQPQDRWVNNWEPAKAAWKRGEKVVKVIGYDFSEHHRAVYDPSNPKYEFWYPLIEWRIDREEAKRILHRAGICPPPKSSCFFCPSTTKSEILRLGARNPDLLNRAIEMERNADLKTVRGLGRRFSWEKFVESDRAQQRLFPEADELPCGTCFDGGE